ncbi:MAG: HDOD domain-containing protein [Chitinispirillaceae bacterium]|nr:HDOD domain-containing protein [Chitinispirillaceae bacterium]
MPSGLLMIENEKEAQILKLGFEQTGVKVVLSKANYRNYTLSLQYMPDFLLMELPRICMEQMHVANLLRKHRRFKTLPILGYGERIDESIKRGIIQSGVSIYLDRPLKFSAMLELLERLLKPYRKSLEIKKTEDKAQQRQQDYEQIYNPSTPVAVRLDLMAQHVSRLLAFPFTVAKVLQITNDEKTGAGHLAQAISVDPTMSANILKVSNSVFFASANRRISSIREAIVRIGFFETKKIVMGMMVMNLFNQNTKNLGFNRIDFWYHSLAAALFAERIAKFTRSVNPEMAFLAGLLHDIGVIILDEFFPDFFGAAIKETSAKSGHFPERTTAMFGMNHNDLVGKLFPSWKIPDDITAAIVNHCHLADHKTSLDTPDKKLTLCVMLGNILAKVACYGRECDQYVWPVDNWIFEGVHIGNVITGKFIADVQQSIEQFRSFLGLEARDYSVDIKSPENATPLRVGIVNTADHLFIPVERYLERKGWVVERIAAAGAASTEQPGRYSIVIVWAGQSAVTEESVKPYTTFLMSEPSAPAEGGRERLAPVLCMVPPDYTDSTALPTSISIIGNRIDLREFDQVIEKVIGGTPVRALSPAESLTHSRAPGPEAPVAA